MVYLDADTLVMRNMDSLFGLPFLDGVSLAAVPDMAVPDNFNSGMMILTPSPLTYQSMLDTYNTTPSYNRGDQGFLNHFFGHPLSFKHLQQHLPLPPKHNNHNNHNNHNTLRYWMPLPVMYNTLVSYQEYAIWPYLVKDTHLLHFTGETKPWDFMSKRPFDDGKWKRNFIRNAACSLPVWLATTTPTPQHPLQVLLM